MIKTVHFVLLTLLCAGLIAVALYMQYVMGLEPCPLCVLQRMAIISVGFFALLAIFFKAIGMRRFLSFLMALMALIGAGLAGWQLWLQNLPADKVPACGPGFDYIVDAFPLSEALSIILKGSGECAEVHWRFLGLSIPGWTFIFFIMIVIFGFMAMRKKAYPDRLYRGFRDLTS